MTDQEITEIIATKVMGYGDGFTVEQRPQGTKGYKFANLGGMFILKDPKDNYVGFNFGTPKEAWAEYWRKLYEKFQPLVYDHDCMMAWDKFVETHHAHMHCGDGKTECWYASMDHELDLELAISNEHTDRRRAMCECMAKAVK